MNKLIHAFMLLASFGILDAREVSSCSKTYGEYPNQWTLCVWHEGGVNILWTRVDFEEHERQKKVAEFEAAQFCANY